MHQPLGVHRQVASCLVATCLVLLSAASAHAISYSWNVASGDWFVPTNWNPVGTPTALDDVVISNNGTCTLDAPGAAIQNLTISSGVLAGNGNLQVGGTMSWSGNGFLTSQISGSGTITVNGLFTINATVFGAKTLSGRTLLLAGGATYTGNQHGLTLSSGAAIINDGTLTFVNDSGGVQGISGSGTFTNNGTVRKQTGNPGSSAVDVTTFHNNGTVEALAGTLTVGGGTSSAGSSYSVSSGATLTFAGTGQSLNATSSISAAGTVRFIGTTTTVPCPYSAATTLIAGGTTTFSGTSPSMGALTMDGNSVGNFTSATAVSAASLTFSNATLGGTANLDVASAMSWTGNGFLTSQISGSGTITVNGLFTINATVFGAKTLSGRTLLLAGGATYTGNQHGLTLSSGAAIINDGTLTFVNDSGGVQGISGSGTFTNNGTVRKQTGNPGSSAVDVTTFHNNGTVEALAGTLTVGGGTSSAGSSYSVSSGATLTFAGTGQSLNATSSISAAGTVRFISTTTTVPCPYSAAATQIAGGTNTFSGASPSMGILTMNGNSVGNFTSGTAVSVTSLAFSNATLGGTANLDVAGAMSWVGNGFFTSLIGGSGTITVNGLFTIDATVFGAKTLSGRTLLLAGGATYTGNQHGLTLSSGAAIINNGTLTFVNDSGGIQGIGGSGTFTNNGTVRKQTGNPGSSGIDVAFTNTGTVESLSGTLSFAGTYTQTAGVTELNGGALTKSGTALNLQGGTLEGTGTLTGSINNTGGSVAPGLSAGQLNQTGAYTQASGGSFAAEIGGLTVGSQYDRLATSGAATLAGTLTITLINGYEPNVDDTFTIMTFASRTGDFGTVNGLAIGNGKAFVKTTTATNVQLQVVEVLTPTPTATPTVSETATPTLTATPTTTETPTPTATETVTPTPTGTVTVTPTPTVTVIATATPIPLNRFTCYQTKTSQGSPAYGGEPNPPGVTLEDQFWSVTAAVKKTTRLCAPTEVDAGPPPAAPDEHLMTYQVKPEEKFLKVLDRAVTDQFGTRHYDVLKPGELMVVSSLGTTMFPPPLVDPSTKSFQCYKLKDLKDPGKFVPIADVTLVDFQTLHVKVKKPTRLCAPVDLDGGDPTASDHPDHLMCYQVSDLKQPAFAPEIYLKTVNDLTAQETDATKVKELCVPATVSP